MSGPTRDDDDRAWAERLSALPRSIEPRADLWPNVERAIAARAQKRRAKVVRLGFGLATLAAAAAVALAVGMHWHHAAATAIVSNEPRVQVGARASADPDGAEGLLAEEPAYRAAIAELRETFGEREGELSPELAGSVRAQLASLDEAIAATRDALAKHPQDAELQAQLRDEYQQEIDVLGDVIDLTTRT